MPRFRPHPDERLLDVEQCCEVLGIGESLFWDRVASHPVMVAGRRCASQRKQQWKASAVALYIEQLPPTPAVKPPAARKAVVA